MNAGPDPWALAASELPLAFSQVREDPRLDLEIVRKLPPGAEVTMIASGGETAVCLARLPLSKLVLVDLNPAQLALTRCRFHLAENSTIDRSMALLGHLPMPTKIRWQVWADIFQQLGLPENALAEPSVLAELGADHCGRYEAAFSELRRILAPQDKEISRFLQSTDPASASRMIAPGTDTGATLEAAFSQAFRLENLVEIFGEEATRNPRQPFHKHFITQLRDIGSRQPPAENPWIWQMLTGKFPPAAPADWLRSQAGLLTKPVYLHAPILDALANSAEESQDFIHLSNILDWLSPAAAGNTLAAAHRALRPGGRILIRQLNSSLDIPSLSDSLIWDYEQGDRLQLIDRSFFYPEILLATRP